MKQSARDQALKAAIREGMESGVSDRTVPDIMEEVEARLRADGRLQGDAEGEAPFGDRQVCR